ncbi:hypothetical protein [Calothrix rhizosoleniae]|uniref:hypothetical protein n=1 Tax=Calothrix rhizosoleniae TaxID=888997 RepID=UPI000B4A3DE8|nr:hypothetical protein [Calothrix rhizosoleniae]
MRKVLIIDTSLLCVWLQVPGMETVGSDDDKWDFQRVDEKIQLEIEQSTVLVLPLAVVVEISNHIAQAKNNYDVAQKLAEIMTKATDETSPWAAFSEQIILWEADKLKNLAAQFPGWATQKTSMGDGSMVILGQHYQEKGFCVEFLTADKGLKAQEPSPLPQPTIRSNQKRK